MNRFEFCSSAVQCVNTNKSIWYTLAHKNPMGVKHFLRSLSNSSLALILPERRSLIINFYLIHSSRRMDSNPCAIELFGHNRLTRSMLFSLTCTDAYETHSELVFQFFILHCWIHLFIVSVVRRLLLRNVWMLATSFERAKKSVRGVFSHLNPKLNCNANVKKRRARTLHTEWISMNKFTQKPLNDVTAERRRQTKHWTEPTGRISFFHSLGSPL